MKAKVLVGLRSMKRWSTDIEHLEWICSFLGGARDNYCDF